MNIIEEIFESYLNYFEGDKYLPADESEFLSGYILGESSLWGNRKSWGEEVGFDIIEQEGGGEGGSEYCYSVFKWKDKYYSLDYSYYSYDGYSNYSSSNIEEVFPKEKTITVYVTKENLKK